MFDDTPERAQEAGQLSLEWDGMEEGDFSPDPGLSYGEVFTKKWVVDLVLDLAGYSPEADLGGRVIIEPSCGDGAFLIPIVDRLIASSEVHGHNLQDLGANLRAFDLLEENVQRSRKAVEVRLLDAGLAPRGATELAATWVTRRDFLLAELTSATADYVVGNPPYLRLEAVPRAVMEAYRRACPTMRGRSDTYVGFIERGLRLLRDGGRLSFICADRWMHNQYGADLRALIADSFSVDAAITMHEVDAFEQEVSAYPAVIALSKGPQGPAAVVDAHRTFTDRDARRLAKWIAGGRSSPPRPTPAFEAARLDTWSFGRDLWPAGNPSRLALLAELERRHPPLQDTATGTRVGIGVATGCDNVFITRDPDLVEQERLLPLVLASDLGHGTVRWSGSYLVDPWGDDSLVDLDQFPELAGYFSEHGERLRRRHVAQVRPRQWYRTIDRVDHGLLARPRILLPDLKAASHPVLDDGPTYPHHGLYYVVSDQWDPEVLGGLLLSDVANLFVGAYCVKMRGGCYRFQAQYLRRIRVPELGSVRKAVSRDLAGAFRDRDRDRATSVAASLYGIDVDDLRRTADQSQSMSGLVATN